MSKIEKMLELAEKIPGFYGYRVGMNPREVSVSEFIFRLNDIKYDYTITFFIENNDSCTEAVIDTRFSDGSIVQISDSDSDFIKAVSFKQKVMRGFNLI